MDSVQVHRFLAELESPFDDDDDAGDGAQLAVSGRGALPSVFAVTDLATAAIAAAGRATACLVGHLGGGAGPGVTPDGPIDDTRCELAAIGVDARLASLWFQSTIAPQGWQLPAVWDAVAGDYQASDGWIKLHTNTPHHRAAAMAVLGCPAERHAVSAAVGRWPAAELEAEIVASGGCAAALRTERDWHATRHGKAVSDEPIVHLVAAPAGPVPGSSATPQRPLAGVRVLDLTRVLAGPVATRFLAGLGADVLRIDPLDWNEPGVVPEVTLGKRCARLDLRRHEGAAELRRLLAGAHILVHGYRPGALDGLGLSEGVRRELAPGLIDVALNAYGWTGPLSARRGFDSLVQFSTGIADTAMVATGSDRPVSLPAQALDHATGYLLAATAIRGWIERLESGRGCVGRASLARTAMVLTGGPRTEIETSIAPVGPADYGDAVEHTSWGPALRLRPPVVIPGAPLRWDLPATALGNEPQPPSWRRVSGKGPSPTDSDNG